MSMPEPDALRHEEVLYLTTVGHKCGTLRSIEIWFVIYDGRLYLLAEHGLKAHWVRNIQANPEMRLQITQHCFAARGRILDDARDHQEWQIVTALSRRKYGWGDGLPVAFDVCEEEVQGITHEKESMRAANRQGWLHMETHIPLGHCRIDQRCSFGRNGLAPNIT